MGEAELPPHLRRYAGALREAAETLLAVIDDILDFSKLDAGRMEVEAIAFELPALVAGVVDLMEVRAAEKGLALALAVPAAAPALVGDPGRLRQVLLNLVGNALRHASAARGAVSVEWGADASGRGALVVADDGPGVPAASRVHLFEPFFTTEARGTGLGLHLARELCTANGATIRYRPACDDPPLRSAFVVEPASPPAPSR
jgi:signal transduction histidine kinase